MNKRIAIFTEYFDSSKTSAGQHMTDLVNEFAKNVNLKVDVYTFDSQDNSSKKKTNYPKNVSIYRLKNKNRRNSVLFLRALNEISISFRVLIFIIRKGKLSSLENILWYSPTIFWGPLALFLKIFKKTKNILILRDIFPQWAVDLEILKVNSLQYYFFRFFELLQYKAAHKIAIQSEGNVEFFKRMPENMDKLIVIKTWYHQANKFAKVEDKIINKIPFNEKKISIYAGNLGLAQNQKLLIEILMLLNNQKEHHFVFIGLKHKDSKAVENLSSYHKLNNLTILDSLSIEELNSILIKSHIGIFSLDSRHTSHNIPGKFLHYISVGIPVYGLSNENNDLNYIIRDNNLGVTYSGNNAEEGAYLFSKFSKEIETNKFTKKNIQRYLTDEISPDKTAKKILKLLD